MNECNDLLILNVWLSIVIVLAAVALLAWRILDERKQRPASGGLPPAGPNTTTTAPR